MSRDAKLHLSLLALAAIVLAWSGTNPKDRLTWLLEVSPAIVAGVVLAAAYPRWRFTPLVIVLIAAHAMILMVGGKYTYAEVPAFNWLKDDFDLSRNYFDRVGHFAQGFVPAMVAREILLRRGILQRGGWLFFLVTCVCIAISTFYEFIEWWTALAAGGAAEAFLGTQGDVWDTQWDMFIAMCGAIIAQLLLARPHDRQIAARPAVETVRAGNP
jgi:putative membrane protein